MPRPVHNDFVSWYDATMPMAKSDTYCALCPVKVEVVDGRVAAVTHLSIEAIEALRSKGCLYHAGDTIAQATTELDRLLNNDRVLRTQLKFNFG